MKRITGKILQCCVLVVGFIACTSVAAQSIDTIKITSLHTGDAYLIITRKPPGFDPTQAYKLVYFTDATLNSGKAILGSDSTLTRNCVLVGIGHIGHHVMRRQRDFIPSEAGGFSSKDFAQAGKFYRFMKEELFPFIEARIVHKKERVFIGHSFGGLLALYFSMRENNMFDQYFAISPSVWANHGELMAIEKRYANKNKTYHSNLYLYAGSLEVFNKVLSSTTGFYDTVKSRNYFDLMISFQKVDWANHYSIVEKVLPGIFEIVNTDGVNISRN